MREWVSCLERLPELSGRNIYGKPYWEGVVFELIVNDCRIINKPWSSTDGAIHIAYRDDNKFYYQERWTDLYCNIRHENYAEYWWMDCGIPSIDEIRAVLPDFME